jgi:hypothetical protein
MFLGAGKKSRKRHIELDIEFKARLSDEELAEKIARIRATYTVEARNEIVGYLLPVAVNVASRYAAHFRNLDLDLVSVAFLELTRTIDVIAEGGCTHTNYIGYISKNISGRCARAVEASRIVTVPYNDLQKGAVAPTCCSLEVDPRLRDSQKLLDPVEDYFRVANLTPDELTIVRMRLDHMPNSVRYCIRDPVQFWRRYS